MSDYITPDDWSKTTPLETYDYIIQGKMFMVSFTASDTLMFDKSGDVWKQQAKRQLSMDLAEKMLEEGVIEFTQMDEPHWGHKIIKARCFLVPNDQVRLLRTLYKDK